MSKRKTLKQKKQAQLRSKNNHLQASESHFNYQELKTVKVGGENESVAYLLNGSKVFKTIDEDSLLAVDPKFIRKDLTKTLVLTIIFIGGIFLLNWALQNGKINF